MQLAGLVRLGSTLRTLSCLIMAIGAGAGFPDPAGAEEPPLSFVSVAAAAQAAAIVIRAPGERGSSSLLEFVKDAGEGRLSVLSAGRGRSLGAGVIIDPRGFALASARVVRQADGFEVALIDGSPLEATVVGLDLRTDVAVLKLHADVPLPYLPLGDSDRVRSGEWVIAVSAPAGLEGTVSAGVITATPAPDSSSPFAGLFQTDAVIGRGGPIVAMNGEVIALGTVARGDRVGYALPANIVRTVYLELVEKGRVSRPWLGVTIQSLTADLARALGVRVDVGALIADVLPRGPAARARLRSGDSHPRNRRNARVVSSSSRSGHRPSETRASRPAEDTPRNTRDRGAH
jgi:S1-C subfamily serine protease